MELNPVLVRNKGFPVRMAKVEPVPDSNPSRWRRVVQDEETGEPVTHTVWVRFDNNSVADIEEAFGSVNNYQSAMSVRSYSTLRKALAVALACEEREVGTAMLAEEGPDYLLAVQMAWSVAMGMDPTQAAKALEEGRKSLAAEKQRVSDEIDAELAESILSAPSLGVNGSADGSKPVATLSSSGD